VGFYVYDANGNVTDLVGTSGSALAHYEYDPFGNPLVATGVLADDNPFRFSTKYTDDETGLVYYGYRYYSPEVGRWLSRDPVGAIGGENLYGFIENNAISALDFLGLWSEVQRDQNSPYGTTCAAEGDTPQGLTEALASKHDIHLDPNEALGANGWLRQDRGQSVSAISAGNTYRIPNSVHLTAGNMSGVGVAAVYASSKRDMRSIEKYFTGRGFYVVNHVEGASIDGNSVGLIQKELKAIYTVAWGHVGHGEMWYKDGHDHFRGYIIVGGAPRVPATGPDPNAYGAGTFKPLFKLSEVVMNVCFGAQEKEQNWYRIIASGGYFWGSPTLVYPGSYKGGWRKELRRHPAP
jgi:RHS repeat-associated protein